MQKILGEKIHIYFYYTIESGVNQYNRGNSSRKLFLKIWIYHANFECLDMGDSIAIVSMFAPESIKTIDGTAIHH